MKINVTDANGGYNVKDLEEIENGAIDIKKNTDSLYEMGDIMRKQVDFAHEDFDTANFDRVYDAIASYQKRLSAFNEELCELISSVHEYKEDKIRRWDWD